MEVTTQLQMTVGPFLPVMLASCDSKLGSALIAVGAVTPRRLLGEHICNTHRRLLVTQGCAGQTRLQRRSRTSQLVRGSFTEEPGESAFARHAGTEGKPAGGVNQRHVWGNTL